MEHRSRSDESTGNLIPNRGMHAPLNSHGHGKSVRIDWQKWLVSIERKRRLIARLENTPPPSLSYLFKFISQATLSSFRLEKIDVGEEQVESALAHNSARKQVRSRLAQRIRNHAAILLCIESLARRAGHLTARIVVRWYTSISNGLSTAALDVATLARLESIVRRINSPQLRLQPALTEVAQLHVQLMNDPFVPSFNGILARLLLQYHIRRCGLPAVVFPNETDEKDLHNENRVLHSILRGIEASFDRMINGEPNGNGNGTPLPNAKAH